MSLVITFLLFTALFGGYLALQILGVNSWRTSRRRAVQWAHGLIGIAGLGALLFVPVQASALKAMGMAWFRPGALAFLGLALLTGLIIITLSGRGRRPTGAIVGTHVTIAIFGITMALAIGLLV